MKELNKHEEIGRAAMKAGMDRKTARKYIVAGTLPSAMAEPRGWRTRPDPFEEHWPDARAQPASHRRPARDLVAQYDALLDAQEAA